MAKNRVDVTINTKKLDAILKHLAGNITGAVAKAGFAIEAKAKQKAPVDTGALRASIYTSMRRTDNSSAAMSAAKARNPEVVTEPLPVPRDDHTAHIGPSVEYGEAIELGSVRRSGTPYLQPAVRETEAQFRELLSKAVKNE